MWVATHDPGTDNTVSPAARILALALGRPATLGSGRVICLDGPAGAGKTVLATEVARLAPTAQVIHMDDLYAGWDGLVAGQAALETLLLPLSQGTPGHYRRFDWTTGRYAEAVPVEPGPLLLIDGVGSWSSRIAGRVGVLAWVEAPAPLRRQRALARDGDTFAPHWERWAATEAALFAREATRDHADLIIDTTQECPPLGLRSGNPSPDSVTTS